MKHIITVNGLDLMDCCRSHMQVLLRSTTLRKNKWLNKDLVFEGVSFMEIQPRMNGDIKVYEGEKSEQDYINSKLSDETIAENDDTVYVFFVGTSQYYIKALGLKIIENNLTSSESSILDVVTGKNRLI